ncbi:hypothetical protein NSMM_180026 [Nitrosomonas mobilis]|uniref:Uncharacterized protein n=1 Tax=Nitrosomonas mobilis TaxID=51642 RepID=A0A1G5SDI9_9PROT|nr:hypothetical protein NSMM_180026 [Nitrosomonas mobilis]
MATIGRAETIEQKIQALLQRTQADGLIVTCDLYKHKDRLRSFNIRYSLSVHPADLPLPRLQLSQYLFYRTRSHS